MSPSQDSTVSDRESVTTGLRRGRPPLSRELMLAAASDLFADAHVPATVTMEDIAAAAGVGKGTVFRAFGSRDGLLDVLFAVRLTPLRVAMESGEPPIGPGAPPHERVLAILDGVLTWKLENRHLIRAREVAGAGLLQSAHYTWLHETIRALIQQAEHAVDDHAGYVAHVLLGALRADLLEELLAAGASPQEIRRAQDDIVHRLLNLADQAYNPVRD